MVNINFLIIVNGNGKIRSTRFGYLFRHPVNIYLSLANSIHNATLVDRNLLQYDSFFEIKKISELVCLLL